MQLCTSDSLEKLSLNDLIQSAQLFDECVEVAREIFKRNYDASKFHVSGPFLRMEKDAIDDDDQQNIHINNLNMVKSILKLFGDLMKKFQISFNNIEPNEGTEILKYVNENCATSLK